MRSQGDLANPILHAFMHLICGFFSYLSLPYYDSRSVGLFSHAKCQSKEGSPSFPPVCV